MDRERVVPPDHAKQIPGETELDLAELYVGVQPHLTVVLDSRRGFDGQRSGAVVLVMYST